MRKLYLPAMEQKEEAKHGEAFFPVQKYITRLDAEYPAVRPHWHEEAELTMIRKGSCRYQIDLVDYEADEGELLFVAPLALHSSMRKENGACTTETYVFHLNFLGGNSTDICSTRYLVPVMNQEISFPRRIAPKHPAYASLRRIFGQISSLYQEAVPGYELALKALLLQTLFLLLQYSEKHTSPDAGTPSDKLKNVLDYIESHYSEPIFVPELASLCCFSEYHFMRFFKTHMNMTCVEYINNLRLEKAVELFEQGNSSILDVSLSVGFRNLSYFHRAFKKKYGVTPLSFIRKLT